MDELKRARERIVALEIENAQLKQDKLGMKYVIDCLTALQRGEQPPPYPEWMLTPTPSEPNARGGAA